MLHEKKKWESAVKKNLAIEISPFTHLSLNSSTEKIRKLSMVFDLVF